MRLILGVLTALLLTACTAESPSEPPAPGQTSSQAFQQARVLGKENLSGRVDEVTIESPALGGKGTVWVIRPEGWTEGSTGWPALYLLHGCCASSGDGWLSSGEAERVTAKAKAVVILPDGGRMGWYTDWVNGPAWETFHMKEVRSLVEPMYGVGDRRAIAGLSMGGHGAMSYASRYPGVFQAAASFSGVLDIRSNPPGFSDFLRGSGAEPDDIWGPLPAQEDNWRAHNPTDLVAGLKGLRLYISCGNGDPGPLDSGGSRDGGEASLLTENTNFAKAAEAAGVEVTTDFYGEGTHRWPYWTRALERALPVLMGSSG
ncbi:alpha/beta hydrolase [Acrocarpospora catenulata]|uniref:alpha/beta hydrolase n=1 Tax=Acrocarpospora catenulata TaxID=2836182 RepID=UPI001BDB4788|nr:alpha/beta hydrolase family protein [Acrocarpospora catenulata]